MANNQDKEELTLTDDIKKTLMKDAKFWLGIAVILAGVIAAFYSVSAKVDINSSKIEALQDNAKQYNALAQNIDSRLSRIEGALGVQTKAGN